MIPLPDTKRRSSRRGQGIRLKSGPLGFDSPERHHFKEEQMPEDLIYRLRKRAEIRRDIKTRKSVQEGAPDRISDLLEEAANKIEELQKQIGDSNETKIV